MYFYWFALFAVAYDKEWEICTVEPVYRERLDSELLLDNGPLSDDKFAYRISTNSFCRHYSYLKLENVEIFIKAIFHFINWIVAAKTIAWGEGILKGGN